MVDEEFLLQHAKVRPQLESSHLASEGAMLDDHLNERFLASDHH